ncbi:MAG: DUF4349 domain-containing protein [Spirochaetota bacterium]|nr:MAG: DUF4349 domain-containing protein [Spirochaetota bacterium]
MRKTVFVTVMCAFCIFFLVSLYGCVRKKAAYEEPDYEGLEYEEEVSLRTAPAAKEMADASFKAEAEVPSEAPVEPSFEPEMRMRVYSGYCKLSVNNAEQTREALFEIAEDYGGYVERAFENTITIRVPAGTFDEVFSQILGLGDVLDKVVETYDVTEQYRDLTKRLEITQETRRRLYRLLEKTDDVEERLKILREIRRLTDEVEVIKQKLDMLKEQIAFSRITVELVPLLAYDYPYREQIPFLWIRNLDPLYMSITQLKGRISFELPGDYAHFKKEEIFRAEGPDGTRVRCGTVRNDPKGDTVFWQGAVAYHLEPFYKETSILSAGNVRYVLLTSKGSEPFYYLVGVEVNRKTIYVIEVLFPSERALEKRYASIKESISRFEVR